MTRNGRKKGEIFGKMATTQKAPPYKRRGFGWLCLHSAGDLTRTEATGADVHMLGSAVHDRLDPLHIGLPGPIGATMGVGDLNAEGHALVAEVAFSHSFLPPRS